MDAWSYTNVSWQSRRPHSGLGGEGAKNQPRIQKAKERIYSQSLNLHFPLHLPMGWALICGVNPKTPEIQTL